MSSTSVAQTKTTAQDGFESAGTPPSNTRRSAAGDRLYRIVWRWHFYAGMIIALPLIVVAATGALYIFKDEVEGVLHPRVLYVEPAAERATYEQQLAAARAAGTSAAPRAGRAPPATAELSAAVLKNPSRRQAGRLTGRAKSHGVSR